MEGGPITGGRSGVKGTFGFDGLISVPLKKNSIHRLSNEFIPLNPLGS